MATVMVENGRGIARRILLINTAIAIFAFVAQVSSLAVYGPSHDYWQLYLTLILIILGASVLSQWVMERVSVFAGMNFYAWACFFCVAAMVIIDATFICAGFPIILFLLSLGVLGLAMTCGYRGTIPYACVCATLILVMGLAHDEVDNALVTVTLLAAAGMMGSESSNSIKRLDRAESDLDELRTAIGVYTSAKREFRELHSGTDRGSAG